MLAPSEASVASEARRSASLSRTRKDSLVALVALGFQVADGKKGSDGEAITGQGCRPNQTSVRIFRSLAFEVRSLKFEQFLICVPNSYTVSVVPNQFNS